VASSAFTHQNASESTSLFTKRGDDITWFRDSSADNLTNCVTSTFRESGAASGGETIDNAGGGKGPQFKIDARRGEGPGDWAT
jgi:hypothetical protein